MKYEEVVGIDVSKKTLDVHLHQKNQHQVFENSLKGISGLINWSKKQASCDHQSLLFVLEHTGMYAISLCGGLQEKSLAFSVVPGLEIKRSQGIQRGKTDKVDAKVIARYGYLNQDKLRLYQLPAIELQRLKKLLGLRERMVRERAGYKQCIKESKAHLQVKDHQVYMKLQQDMVKLLDKRIELAEDEIQQTISSNEVLDRTNKLLISITGIGNVTSANMIVLTSCFTLFKAWRKFACYAGTAPFPYQSGTSIRGRTKVSQLANKRIKCLLDCSARCAIQYDQQLHKFYERKVEEGKSKRCVLNAVRNKLIARMFAVVNRQTPYVNTMKYA